MTTYNTGNAIGSTDARDLYDNVQNLDHMANSSASTYSDRRGVQRRTLAGLEAEFPNAQANSVAAAASATAAAASATQAANEAASAETAVGLAFNEATASQASRVAAEAARDAAMLSAGVYATTAAGLSATTSGRYFSVPSADSAEYLILYLNNAGVAVEKKRYPSVAGIPAQYPFRAGASNIPVMLKAAIHDIYVEASDRSLRLAFHTVERGGASGWYIRVGIYNTSDTRDTTLGTSGLVAIYQSLTNPEPPLVNGRRLQRVTLTPQGAGATKVLNQCVIDIDWEAITGTDNLVATTQSYLKAGFSERVFSGASRDANWLSRSTLLPALPRNTRIWAKNNTFSVARLDQVFLDVALSGADPAKRYGFGPITYTYGADGRIILWLSELLADGTLGNRVALFDRTGSKPTASAEGEIETVFLAPYNNSGVSANVKVNWSSLLRRQSLI